VDNGIILNLEKMSLPIVVIACKVFQGLIDEYFPDGRIKQITFLEYGLHSIPKKLNESLQEQINTINDPSVIVIGYGLCGNGLHQIKSDKHILLIPRVDDCIAIFLGSYQAYLQEFNTFPGTYYLSKGWLEAGSNPLDEFQEYVQKYGTETAAWIMDQQYRNYRRLAFVVHQNSELITYGQKAKEIADYCTRWGMKYEKIVGSDGYIRRLVDVAFALDRAGEDFIVVPPGGQLTQKDFIR